MSSISAQAAQLLRDEHADKDYLFEADVSEIPATIDQAQATQKATAGRFVFMTTCFSRSKASNLSLSQLGFG
jgi:hypothetical protein